MIEGKECDMVSVNDSYGETTGSRISDMAVGAAPDGSASLLLGQRLNALFEREALAGRPRTNNAIAQELRERNPGLRVSGGYLSALRNGGRAHPSIELLKALSAYFEVPIDHLAAPSTDEQAALAAELVMREEGIRALALRAQGLGEASLASIAAIIDNARKLEGLPAADVSTRNPADG
jgi:transcriptional regulator with XRE-family HTH domain